MDKIPAYVINLPRSAERRRFMEVHLAEFPGIDTLFVEAVNGAALGAAEMQASYDEAKACLYKRRPLTRGEIGCALSHRNCYLRMLAEQRPYVLVLEDDIILSAHAVGLLPVLAQWLQSDQPRVVLLTPGLRYWRWPRVALPGGYRLHPICKKITSTAAYMINPAAARILAERIFPIHTVADDWRLFAEEFGIGIWTVVPHCVGLRVACQQSTIKQTEDRFTFRKRTSREKWERRLKNLWFRPLEHLGIIAFNRERF
jgi:glycosyl transferase family 25